MKKSIIFIILSLALFSPTFSQVSKEKAYRAVKEVLQKDWEKDEVYVTDTPVEAGMEIELLGAPALRVESKSWFFFVDLMPYANWGHDCIYAFVDCESGDIDTVHHLMPPITLDQMEVLNRVVPLLNDADRVLFDIPTYEGVEVSTNRYAVIISGGASAFYNHERYWNDCSAIYKVLRNKYHYNRSKIFVLMSDGTDPGSDMHKIDGTYASSPLDLDGDGTNDIQYAATKANISLVFNILQQRVTGNDHVFIFTTDHGGVGSTLNLWGESMTLSEFTTEVNKLSAAKTINVCMEQCYSGGYATSLAGDNRVIATACTANEPSWAMSNLVYNEFCYYWISAVAGQTPAGVQVDADYNNDGYVSMEEAFEYANTHDTRPETPQFSAPYIPNLGPYLTLSGLIPQDVDLMVRDSVGDNGQIPSGVQNMWHSPDIWLEDMNGNVITNPHGNTECKVCVKITNLSDMPTYGGERLYLNWAKAGCDLRWSQNWLGDTYFNCGSVHPRKGGPIGNSDGMVIPIIPANGSVVVKVTWHVPRAEDYQNCTQFAADLWHFCLVARVHDDENIVGESSTNLGMGYFTVWNNNVAWKNVSILNAQYHGAVVTLSNPYEQLRDFRLRFRTEPNKEGDIIFKYAEVYVRLEDELVERWLEGGSMCDGGKYLGENKFRIMDNDFVLNNIIMEPDRHYTMEASVQFLAQTDVRERQFVFDFIEECGEEIVGAERYIAVRDKDRYFVASVMGERDGTDGECVDLVAEDIGESAQYTWYSMRGDILAPGPELHVCPERTTQYVLEVVADVDGYKDYDTVTVVVRTAAITALTPNPATNQTEVSYFLGEGMTGVSLVVASETGRSVYTVPLNGDSDRQIVSLQALPAGQYIIRLERQGEILDTKTLVVY